MLGMSGTMYSRILALAVLAAILTLSNSIVVAATLKIMPLGDSITYGIGAAGGYRLPLYDLLATAGYDFQFVGSVSENSASMLPATQRGHEGHVAYAIQSCTTTADGEARHGILENVTTWVRSTTPDVILLMIGTNDINANYDRGNAPSRLGNLLTTIAGLEPRSHVIVAQITPIGNGAYSSFETDELAQVYNAGVAAVVTQHQAAGELVSLVDMHSALSAQTDLSDGLHPNQGGYNKMARVWYDGIHAVVPEPNAMTLAAIGLLLSIGSACAKHASWRKPHGIEYEWRASEFTADNEMNIVKASAAYTLQSLLFQLGVCGTVLAISDSARADADRKEPRRCVACEEVALTMVEIRDDFWSPKLTVYRENSISNAWPNLAPAIEGLKRAAAHEKRPVVGSHLYDEGNVYKTLEAASCSLAQVPNAELERRVNELLAIIAAAQQPDGCVYAHALTRGEAPWSSPRSHEDGYVVGHLIEAAVAHYRTTGKKALLNVACKAADQAWRHFIELRNPGFPNHAEIELALVELYRVTGNRKYLDLSREFIERRGHSKDTAAFPLDYYQDDLPIRQQKEIKGHAVRAVFFATGVADAAMETGDPDLCEAARRLWNSATQRKMYVVGAVGSRPGTEGFGDDYELPNREGYCESCSNCGMVNFAHRMNRMDGNASAVDVLERALYNAVLHGIALDGRSTYSYATPLSDANHPRSPWGMCCAATLPRTLLQVGRYAYAYSGSDVYVNLFLGGECRVPLKVADVTLRVKTQYPWKGLVEISVEPARTAEFTVRVRVPGWSHGPTVLLNGTRVDPVKINKGYAVVRRVWNRGDVITVDMPMPVMRIEAHPAVAANRGKVAIQRGPLVYGVEGLDNDGRTSVSLPANPQFVVEYRENMLGGVTIIRGQTIDNKPFTAIPYYSLANRANSSQDVWLAQAGKTDREEGWDGLLYREYLP